MRMIPLAVLPVLAACQAAPAAPPPAIPPMPAPSSTYRALGTEPFWDLVIGPRMTFTDRGNNIVVVQPTPAVRIGIAGEMYDTARLRVNIVHARCSDGMSNRAYPDSVQVYVDGRMYKGCGAPAAFFVEVDERGNPRIVTSHPLPATTLERTRWRVVRINGRKVPRRGDFHVDFDSGRIAAQFGCNRIGGPYSQAGATLTAGPLAATRMACPAMALEQQGGAILAQVMTVEVLGRNRLALSSSAGSLDLVRR